MYVHDVLVIRVRNNAIPFKASIVVGGCIEGEDAGPPRVSRHLARHALVAVTAPGLVVYEEEHLLQQILKRCLPRLIPPKLGCLSTSCLLRLHIYTGTGTNLWQPVPILS